MTTGQDRPLVSVTDIPWERLTRTELEECVFWLLDALGAKELEWRRGGSGQGAADQGRDLQAIFEVPSPDGSFERQCWWIEAKGRAKTVDRAPVQKAVADAEVHSEVDVLLVVTNGAFSNPARDWANERNAQHRRPLLKLWPRDELERLLSRHPAVAARLFESALTEQGLVAATTERVWDRMQFAHESTLRKLWDKQDDLEFDVRAIFSIIASECANGDLSQRPWITLFGEESLLNIFGFVFRNTVPLEERAAKVGVLRPISDAMRYILVGALMGSSPETVYSAFDHFFDFASGPALEEIRNVLLGNVVKMILHDFLLHCGRDCKRVSLGLDADDPKPPYWLKYKETDDSERLVKKDNGILIIETKATPCKVGFDMEDNGCPLVHEKPTLLENLAVIQRVAKFRANLVSADT